MIKSIIHRFGRAYIRRICQSEYRGQSFRWINERPVEYRFLFNSVARFCPERVLDVGTGKSAVPSLLRTCGCRVTAIDNVKDYWPTGMINRHWHVIDDNICASKITEKFDLVSCISVLEHIQDHDTAVRSMFSHVPSGGIVVITCPYNESSYIENAYQLPGAMYGQDAPYVCQVYSRANVERWASENGAELLEQEYWQFFTGKFWTCGELVRPPKQVAVGELHQLTCLLFRKR